MRSHAIVMRKSWEIYKKVMRKSWESQKKPLKSYEKVMRKSWERHEKVMKKSWESKKKSQESHVQLLRKSWESDEKFMSNPYSHSARVAESLEPRSPVPKFLAPPPFLKRAIKSFSVDSHIFRGIINKIRKSLRWGTPISVKLFETIWTPNINEKSVNHSINQASNLRH